MSNGQKWLLALICIGIMMIPFIQIMLPTHMASEPNTRKSAIASSASGIFIVPPGGKEISKDTAGQRFFPNNVGEIVAIHTISPKNPSRLFFLNESGTRIKIDPGLTRIEITDIGKKPYIRFANYSDRTAKIKVL